MMNNTGLKSTKMPVYVFPGWCNEYIDDIRTVMRLRSSSQFQRTVCRPFNYIYLLMVAREWNTTPLCTCVRYVGALHLDASLYEGWRKKNFRDEGSSGLSKDSF